MFRVDSELLSERHRHGVRPADLLYPYLTSLASEFFLQLTFQEFATGIARNWFVTEPDLGRNLVLGNSARQEILKFFFTQ